MPTHRAPRRASRRAPRRISRFAIVWGVVLFSALTAGTATHAYWTATPASLSPTATGGTVDATQTGFTNVSATPITVTNTGSLDADVSYTLRSSSAAVASTSFSAWYVWSTNDCTVSATPPGGTTTTGALPGPMTGYLPAGVSATYCLRVETNQEGRARHSGTKLELTGDLAASVGNWTGGSSQQATITIVDNKAPTAPSVSLDRVSGYSTRVNWSGASDDVGVAGYRIYRNNSQVASVSASTAQWTDTSLRSDTTYRWAVEAYDAAGNVARSGITQQRTLAISTDSRSYLYFVNGGRCVDVSGADTALGSRLIIWDCINGGNQIFSLRASGDGTYQFEPTHATNWVIGSPNANAGQQLLTSEKSSANSRWFLQPDGSGYRFVNAATGLCMDIQNNNTSANTPVTQWTCGAGNSAQRFEFRTP